MKKKRPMSFHPEDWMGDVALSSCSLAAQGLWMRLICIAHESTLYGHVLVAGKVPTDEQLARLVGCSVDALIVHLAELEGAEVFSRGRNKEIVSRRMRRDFGVSLKAKKGAKSRWSQPIGGTGEKQEPQCDLDATRNATRNAKPHAIDVLVDEKTEAGDPAHIMNRARSTGNKDSGVGDSLRYPSQVPNIQASQIPSSVPRDPMRTGMVGIYPGKDGSPHCAGWNLEVVFSRILRAARMPDAVAATMTWGPLTGWLIDGYEPDDIVALVERVAGREGYRTARTLAFFDRMVRQDLKPGKVYVDLEGKPIA